MRERNEFLESDGLIMESDTHEWFIDKMLTRNAQEESYLGKNDRINMVAYIVRDKSTGDYERVLVDNDEGEPVFATTSLTDMSDHISKLKILKHFENYEQEEKSNG